MPMTSMGSLTCWRTMSSAARRAGWKKGKAACVEFHRRWLADFPDAHVEVRARHMIDDVVVEEGTFRGTHDGVAPTGRSVSLDYVRVVKVHDGKQVALNLMFDRLLMLEQLGLV
jgi:hypothetical protein